MPLAADSIRPPKWLRSVETGGLSPTLFIFGRPQALESVVAGRLKLVHLVARTAIAAGLDVELVGEPHADANLATDPQHLRLFLADRPVYAANALHAVGCYLRGYTYLEETGTRNNSSIRLKSFDPMAIDGARATGFADRLRKRFVGGNLSKMAQRPRESGKIPQGCLAVFAQDFAQPRWHRHFLTMPEMLEAAIAARGSRPVVIKPHPKNSEAELAHLQTLNDPRRNVHVTHASVHDLLDAADCAVSLTSACSFEAFLHHTPSVVCGQTDFHHNAVTLTDATRMAAAIDQATAQPWPFDKYLTWFLQDNCVEDSETGLPEALTRIYRKGFPWASTAANGWF
jgi:hypothetical protein